MGEELRTHIIAARKPHELSAGGHHKLIYDVSDIPGSEMLPRSLVILLENVVRRAASDEEAISAAEAILAAGQAGSVGSEIAFMPARVLFQDFTGVPVFVDFACMRDEVARRGGDPAIINPHIPCTLVIDHSVVADVAGQPDACARNLALEAERNRERFAFLKWASTSFSRVEIVPPGQGICHQLNIERFAQVVAEDTLSSEALPVACFDTLVGTDSHTTTANGAGVLGWGVGGIEAEAASLGQPITMLVPPVVELRLEGELGHGAQGMDLALNVARLLREAGVVGSFVEVTGPGVATLTATQRACVANMTPEYGATATLFPVDEQTLDYLRLTGRDEGDLAFAEAYLKAQGIFGADSARRYARTLTLDLSEVGPCLAGPSRPHDQVSIAELKGRVEGTAAEHRHAPDELCALTCGGEQLSLGVGTIAIAAITSCTTATDPAMMVAAGLTAAHARERGLTTKPWVKTILAPGSHVSELLLKRAGLLEPLQELGFYTCGFGCMSCIGNSGDILPCLHEHAAEMELTSVLSGNRNFEGRISADVSQNYLAAPSLVVAYALAGSCAVNLAEEPLGYDAHGTAVMLADILPSDAEVASYLDQYLDEDLFCEGGKDLFVGSAAWEELGSGATTTFSWDPASTYVRRPPYFEIAQHTNTLELTGARPLVLLGDFVTTDHISPAGSIAAGSPAARYLEAHGVAPADFNSYGARRGNHEVMERGTFANVKLNNLLAPGEGPKTRDVLDGEVKPIWDAATHYAQEGVPAIVVAGKLYGSGSSRDWAAKGPLLQGVRAVIAETFERIHRSNLIGMGILPLEFTEGQSAESLGLDGTETFDIAPIDISAGLPDPACCEVTAHKPDGSTIAFTCRVRIDTPQEGYYMRSGGILPYVLESMLADAEERA